MYFTVTRCDTCARPVMSRQMYERKSSCVNLFMPKEHADLLDRHTALQCNRCSSVPQDMRRNLLIDFSFRPTKGTKDSWKRAAEKLGMSTQRFVIEAVNKEIEKLSEE